jgi:hypothetical protein
MTAMPRDIRRFIAALLIALALPIQGMAAVSAGVCMGAGGHDSGHGHEATAHDHHAAQGEGEESSEAHCPPCVSCCAAAFIAPSLQIAFPEAVPVAAIAAPQHWIAGAPPDNPDRPPLSA